jgi:hypothetical protein
VSLVGVPPSLSGARKRLARAASGPKSSICRPSCQLQGERPTSDSGKKVCLSVLSNIVGLHVGDASGVDEASGNVTGGCEVAEPSYAERVDFIVVVHRPALSSQNFRKIENVRFSASRLDPHAHQCTRGYRIDQAAIVSVTEYGFI